MLRKLVEQAASVAAIRIVGTALSVAVTIAIARLYGAEALGVYAYCVVLLAFATVPVSYGWSNMLLRTVSRRGEIDSEAAAMTRMGAMLAIGVALLAGTAAFVAIEFATTDIAETIRPLLPTALVLLGIALMCDQLSAMRMATLRGLDRPSQGQIPEMLVRPLVLIAGIGLSVVLFGDAEGPPPMMRLFAALALAALVSMALGNLLLRRFAPARIASNGEAGNRGKWLVSAAALAGSAGLVQLNGYVDLLILGAYVSAEQLGHYRAALQVAMLANFGYIALNMLAGQRFSKLLASGDHDAASRTATMLARLALLAALPLPITLIFFGHQLFGLLLGSEFWDSVLPSLIVAAGVCFSAAVGMSHALLVMSHGEFIAMRITFAALVCNVLLCILLIPSWGLVGAACANAGASVLWNSLLWYFARRRTGIDSSILAMLPQKDRNQTAVRSVTQQRDDSAAGAIQLAGQKLYLHIGTHKTGSSSLQNWLGRQRSALKRRGFDYFVGEFEPDNHVGLFATVMNEGRRSFAHEKYEIGTTRSQLSSYAMRFAEFRANGGDRALIASSEGLSLLRHDAEMERLKEILGSPLPDVSIILVLRNKADFLQSWRNQILKHPGRQLSNDPNSVSYVEPDSWLADYDAIKSIWSRHFGAEALKVIDYDAALAEEGDVLPSILRAMEFPPELIPPPGSIRINSDGPRARLRRILRRFHMLR